MCEQYIQVIWNLRPNLLALGHGLFKGVADVALAHGFFSTDIRWAAPDPQAAVLRARVLQVDRVRRQCPQEEVLDLILRMTRCVQDGVMVASNKDHQPEGTAHLLQPLQEVGEMFTQI